MDSNETYQPKEEELHVNYNHDNIKESTQDSLKIIKKDQTSSNEIRQKINESENVPMKINKNENVSTNNENKIDNSNSESETDYINSENEIDDSNNESESDYSNSENEMDSLNVKEIKKANVHHLMYPLEDINKLSKNNQNLVEEAENNAEKQYEVGRFLIKGINYFPNYVKLGLQYIERSMNLNCINAIIYYIKLLIKGKIIPEDLTKANEYLLKLSAVDDTRKFLLQGLMS